YRSREEIDSLLQFALVNGGHVKTVEVPDTTQLTPDAYDHHLNEFNKRQRRYAVSDRPFMEWIPFRDEYLAEMIRGEGRGDGPKDSCWKCQSDNSPLYRCVSGCLTNGLVCAECCLLDHLQRPLDIIEKWNGSYFERIPLQQMGLSVQLGHSCDSICPAPRIVKNFTVIHTNGIHQVTALFCNCVNRYAAGEWRQQLHRRRWFAATHLQPETAATYEVLNHFHVLTLQGKVTTYDYYAGLEKLYDNLGTEIKVDRYKAFSRMIREWRGLKILKRGGMGNDATRTADKTELGELAVKCIACPRPSENLPEDWEDEPANTRFKYWLYLAEDACFQLKRRLVSSNAVDPGVGTGSSYFVEDNAFREYIATCGEQVEMNTCTGLSAVDHANTKFSRGYATTGVGLAVCARHELVQKNGVVDLQKGERYCNMDYAFGSILRTLDPRLTIVQSYDIVCQWSKNLAHRMKELPQQEGLMVRESSVTGHTWARWQQVPEIWAQVIGTKSLTITSVIGIGVASTCSFIPPLYNWDLALNQAPTVRVSYANPNIREGSDLGLSCGICRMGQLLLKRYDEALDQQEIHNKALLQFRTEHQDDFEEWDNMITVWEGELLKPPKDRTAPNPFESIKSGMTEQDIRLALAQEEEEEASSGSPSLHDVGPSAFISQMLDIQDTMRSMKFEMSKQKSETVLQKTSIIQRRTKLVRAIAKICALQTVYMPAAIQKLAEAEDITEENTKDTVLVFPSDLSDSERESGCRAGILAIERKLREGQLSSSLDKLRNNLHIKSRLLTYRTTNVAHQARKALTKIVGGEQNVSWHQLHAKDVCMMQEEPPQGNLRKRLGKRRRDEDEAQQELEWQKEQEKFEQQIQELQGTEQGRRMTELQRLRAVCGEGKRRVSWIWMACGNGALEDEAVLEEGIQVEYCQLIL
ncbi:hypothetical protein F5880DRAFT_1511225, partial [Lentinula raphanica]